MTNNGVTVYYRRESVVVSVNNQNICFHRWGERDKRPLYYFAKSLNKNPDLTISDVYARARKYKMQPMAVSKAAAKTTSNKLIF